MANEVRNAFLKEQAKIESLHNSMIKGATFIGDSATAKDEGYGFLYNALEWVDARIHTPLVNFYWYRDLPYRMGGGALEYASFFKVNYSFDDSKGIASGSNNVVTTVSSALEKVRTRVAAFSFILRVGLIDNMKSEQIDLNILDQLHEGILMKYNTLVDSISFFGLPQVTGSVGLFNNSAVAVDTTSVTADWGGSSFTAAALLDTLNDNMLKAIEDSGFDKRATPNRILVPAKLFVKLAAPLVVGSTPVAVSLWKYLKDNLAANYALYDGTVDIFPNPYLSTVGTNSNGRIVIYRYDEDMVRGIMGMELTRGATLYDPSDLSFKTAYVSFIGEPQFIYTSNIRYIDNHA